MENFIVSARKYRPSTFNSVVGQKHITSTLKNAIKNNHLAQAFLFTGPRGVGKTTCARILAKTINCKNPTEDFEACNQCESCLSFNETTTFNIHELDAASNNSVDDIRALVDQVRIPPQDGKYKVYIIDEVHMLSQAAFNAFLKTLEEPPAYAKFILATTEKHKIIPTILSRCQIYDFHRITLEDIANHLDYVAKSENIDAEQDGLLIIAQKADGALRDALSIFDQLINVSGNKLTYEIVIENLNVLDYDYYFRLTGYFLKKDLTNSLLLFNEIIDLGFEGQHFVSGLASHFRNLLVCQDAATVSLLEVGDSIKSKYIQQAKDCSVRFLIQALELANKTDLSYKTSNNKRLQVELCLMQICSIGDQPAHIQNKPIAPPVQAQKKTLATTETSLPKAAEEKPVAKKTVKLSGIKKKPSQIGSISITQSLNESREQEQEELIADYDIPDKVISKDELVVAIKKFAATLEEDQPTFAKTLISNEHEINEKNHITITLDNAVQDDPEDLSKLLGYIKKDLNNRQVKIKAKVTEIKKEIKAYSSTDKYKKMFAKNPMLAKMKDELELDLDY